MLCALLARPVVCGLRTDSRCQRGQLAVVDLPHPTHLPGLQLSRGDQLLNATPGDGEQIRDL